MRQVVPFRLSSGGQVLVEVNDDHGVVRAGTGPGDVLMKTTASLARVFDDVRDAADDALSTMRRMSTSPSQIQLAFGVSLTAEANAVITKAGAEANLTITVVWERDAGGDS